MGMQIIHQSNFVIQVWVIYQLGNILIALWRNSSACEIRFTIEHHFCQKLHRDHHRSPPSGEYFEILLDSLTICPWRDYSNDRNASGTLLWLICSCHSVFLGTSSSGSRYTFYNSWSCFSTIFGYRTYTTYTKSTLSWCTVLIHHPSSWFLSTSQKNKLVIQFYVLIADWLIHHWITQAHDNINHTLKYIDRAQKWQA